MKTFFLRVLFVVPVALIMTLSSCREDPVKPANEFLVEATPFLTRTASELQTYLEASALEIDPSDIRYDVEIFKVKYRTTYKDEEIIASGIVVLPQTDDEVGMVSFQHGTIVTQKDAPTSQALSSTQLVLYAAMASAGFIGVIPDYIGFGESSDKFHPYYVEEATANAVIDNLEAAREWAADNSTNFNGKLFLAGYSQGGYATMAAHKAIETEGLEHFNLIASFPAAGGYDIKGVQEHFFSQDTYDQPYYLAYVAMSYQNYYGWTTGLTDFFREPYASRIPGLFNGINSPGQINAELTQVIPDLVQPDLIENLDTNPKYAYLVGAFDDNSLVDWVPQTRMYLYHGDADTIIPYENSVNVYDHFISLGASPNVVSLTPLPGATHQTGIIPYIENFIEIVLELK